MVRLMQREEDSAVVAEEDSEANIAAACTWLAAEAMAEIEAVVVVLEEATAAIAEVVAEAMAHLQANQEDSIAAIEAAIAVDSGKVRNFHTDDRNL